MRTLLLMIFTLILTGVTFGQPLTGDKYIPGSGGPNDYLTIAAAVTALNANGVGTGGVTFNVAAGHTETSANILITTPTGSAANPIVFQKSGAGANPLVTAEAGASATLDGIIKIQGTDYVTFDGIDVLDPVSNTTATTRMEFGYAILMTSATDASQNITIVRCNITLQKAYTASPYSIGIYSKNHTAASTTLVTPSSAAGIVSNCRVDECAISDVIYGISWTGNSTAANYGLDNYFGFTTGNNITNFGGAAVAPYGIYTIYQNNLKIKNNNITGGDNTTTSMYGIYSTTGVNANVEIYRNTVILTTGAASSTTYGIYNTAGGTGTNNLVNISRNTVTINYPLQTTGIVYGIYHSATAWSCEINENSIIDCVLGNGTTTATGTFYGLYTSGSNTTAGSTWNINMNTVNNNNRTQSVRGTGIVYGMDILASGLTCSVSDNNVFSNSWPSSSDAYGIYVSNSTATSLNVANNAVYGISKPTAVTNVLPRSGSLYGLYVVSSGPSALCTMQSNNVYNLTNTWGGQVMPYRCDGGTTSTMKFFSNRAYAITSNDRSIFGIYSGAGLNVEIYGNRLYDMNAAVGDSGIFYGICTGSTTAGSVSTVYNNYISDLRAPEANIYLGAGLYLFGSTAGTTHRYYNNTVYLNQTGTAGSPALAGVYANTAPTLDMRNNILVNHSTGGFNIAYWRSTTSTATHAAGSNYNLMHSGTPGASNVIFYDFTNADLTIGDYQLRFPQEGQSFSAVPPFIDVTTKPYNLRLNAAIATACESGGSEITSPAITTDYDVEPRFPNPGYPNHVNPSYAASAPDVGADEFGGIPSFSCTTPNPGNTLASANNFCLGTSTTLSMQNPTPGTGVSFQWQSSPLGVTYTNIIGAVISTYTFMPTAPHYYRCVVSCQNGPSTGTSNPVQITFTNSVASTTPGNRCGTGTVSLGATIGTGTTLNWYAAAIGGASLGTGSPFTTPVISATTSYYVGAESFTPAAVSIGTGTNQNTTTTYPAPYGNYYETSKHQMLILASELTAAGVQPGNIDYIGFDVASLGTSGVHNDFTIKMASTALTAMTTSFVTTGLTTVFGPVNYQPLQGINTHTFTTPFVWDGTSNVIVETCFSNDPTGAGIFYTVNAIMNRTTTAFNSVAYMFHDNVNDCPLTTGATTSNIRPNMSFAGYAICSSARSEVVATVTTPPVLTITAGQTICNNEIYPLQVTSTLGDFDTYTWSPVTNLFTDAACTVPYVALTNASMVYVRSSTGVSTTYTCTGLNTTTLCSNTAQATIITLPSVVITSMPAAICISGSATLSLTPTTGYGSATIQWQNSPDNVTFTDITGATTASYVTPTITATTYYKAVIRNSMGTICSEPVYMQVVNNPQVLTTTPATRCGPGTLSLQATGSAGATLNWYDVASGGTSLGTGSPFVTPVISATTSYYVSASLGGGSANVGKVGIEPNASNGGGLTTYMNFTAISDFTLQTVDLFPYGTGPGTVTIELRTSAGTPIMSQTFNVTGTTNTASPPETVTLNFPVAGGASYRLGVNSWTGGVTNLYRDNLNFAYPYVVPGVMSIDGPSTSGYYYFFYNWLVSTGCTSARMEVVATVTPAPDLTISGNNIMCHGAVYQVDVMTGLGSFDTYTWSPATHLFTDPACTVPYAAMASATTVYVKSATGFTQTYTCTATNTSSGCVNTALTTITVIPVPVLSSIPAAICVTGSATLNLTPSTGYGDATFQWYESSDNVTFNEITGATTMSYPTPTHTVTHYYKIVVKNGSGATCSETFYTMQVTDPQVTGTTPGSRCGIGTVALGASGSGGTLNWYASATGGNSLGTGPSFTTPVISTTTSYYVSVASPGATEAFVGMENSVSGTSGAGTTTYGLYFDALSAFTLRSVKVYPNATANNTPGTVVISVLDGTGAVLHQATVNVTGMIQSSNPTSEVVDLNFDILPANALRLVMTSKSSGISGLMFQPTAGGPYPYPYTLPGIVSITSGTYGGTVYPLLYYYFYNWKVSVGCASPRMAVVASVTPAPDIFPTATPDAICAGSSSVLNVTSGNTNYTYNWMPGNLSGPTHTVYLEIPTNYSVTATDAGTGCVNIGSAIVSILSTPSPITITPDAPVILPGAIQQLVATGGTITGNGVFGNSSTTNTATTYPAPYTNYYGGAKHQMLILASELTAAGLSAGTPITSITFRVTELGSTFTGSLNNFQIDMGHAVETVLTSTAFLGGLTNMFAPATVPITVGNNTHTLAAPFVWDGTRNIVVQTSYSNANTGTSTDYVLMTNSDPGFVSTNWYRADGVTAAAILAAATPTSSGNARPNMVLGYSVATTMAWLPITELYTDAGASTAYAGENLATVYAKPTVTRVYTVTATAPSTGCTRSEDVTVTIYSVPVNLAVTGTVVGPPAVCYNATNTITVAESSPFTIQSGGSVEFIAGVNIIYKPGTTVQSGGYMYGHIAPGGPWCPGPTSPVVITGTGQDLTSLSREGFTLYPNPTNGNFILAQKGDKAYGTVKVEVYSMSGTKVMTERMIGEQKHEFRFAEMPTGLYFVKVVADDYVETIKLVKTR